MCTALESSEKLTLKFYEVLQIGEKNTVQFSQGSV